MRHNTQKAYFVMGEEEFGVGNPIPFNLFVSLVL